VPCDELPGDGEPESEPSLFSIEALPPLGERIKNPPQEVGGDAGTVVGDFECDLFAL
jgi:hypothetical protein